MVSGSNQLIITHGGRAHFDEFLAISLILATHDTAYFTIERRDPTKEEMNNPDIWVVDVGGKLEPEKHNFDHHQDLNLPASFVMIAEHLELTSLLEKTAWWDYKDNMDRFGPYNLGREMGIDSLVPTISPLENWFLKMFESSPIMVYQLMALFGRSLIEQARKLEVQLKFWASCSTVKVKNRIALIGLTDDSDGSQEYRDTMPEPADFAITFDRRGDGWRFYRFNDVPGVDFSRLESHPEIKFAHKGGFIAKTSNRIPLAQVLKIVEGALD